jgi:hypothetical protein
MDVELFAMQSCMLDVAVQGGACRHFKDEEVAFA